MVRRVRALARVGVLAAALAILGFGAAGYGIFSAVPVTNAILETTSQSPASVLPRPSPGIVPTGSVTGARASDETPLLAVLLVAGIGATVLVIRRRKALA